MSTPLTGIVDPRVHALRTLAQFLTRYGPVQPSEDAPSSPGPPSRGQARGTDPSNDSPTPRASTAEGDFPCTLSA